MVANYSALLEEYPPVISMDQLYRICHISKRKAVWLLEHGVIPCQDSGKKTRRFKINTTDVIEYLYTLEFDPASVSPPVGIFKNVGQRPHNPIAMIKVPAFKKYLRIKWAEAPDALEVKDISKMTGYVPQTIGQWITKKRLRSIHSPGGTVVAKAWLIDYIAAYTVKNPGNLSNTNRNLAHSYLTSYIGNI